MQENILNEAVMRMKSLFSSLSAARLEQAHELGIDHPCAVLFVFLSKRFD